MKSILSILLILFIYHSAQSQSMTEQKLEQIIRSVSDSIEGSNGRWQFYVNDVIFICVSDANNNRMRIISPIVEAFKLDEDLKTILLKANFHSALDIKYTIANDLVWSAFIHPLKELSTEQLYDAISQVYSANKTFGTTFASTELIFPGASSSNGQDERKEVNPFKKQRI